MEHNLQKIIELVKTVIITLLVFMLLLLAVTNILQLQRNYRNDNISLNELGIVIKTTDASTFSGFNKNHFLPEIISISLNDEEGISKGVFSSANIINQLYYNLSLYFLDFMGPLGICVEVQQDSAVWYECINDGSYVRIKFRNELPLSVIYGSVAEKDNVKTLDVATGGNIYIKEILMSLSAVSVDSYSVTVFTID